MTRIVSTNITSPLGLSTRENYAAVKRGESSLKEMEGCLGLPGRFCVGIFSDAQRAKLQLEGFSWFESLVIHSVREALGHTDINPRSPRTVFILGTTTAGVGELAPVPEEDGNYLVPGVAAQKIADELGFAATPITVSNACISSAAAQVLAERLIASGDYDSAVVCGADVVSAFVLAGFDSFKALSQTECRPFDMERLGLNIGEGAATLVLTGEENEQAEGWHTALGCLNNDAYHVSAPIPSGDGLCRAIRKAVTPELLPVLACVTAHGTATLFNDQMESKAIANAGLGELFTTAYKAHYGHTFGASSLLESILTMCSLDEGCILPVRGFNELGVSGKIKICQSLERTDKKAFLKTQSGFGACNAALVYAKFQVPAAVSAAPCYQLAKRVEVGPDELRVQGQSIPMESTGTGLLSEIFKKFLADGSRFFKMDFYSRLAYAATALLAMDSLDGCLPEDRALLIFTCNGSVLADRKHLSTFTPQEGYYPSPAVFINTLPNVVLGEIAVTTQTKGETTLVMLPHRDDAMMDMITEATIAATSPSVLMCGWVDYSDENCFSADLKLLRKKD